MTKDELVEKCARAMCEAKGMTPDCLYQHNFEGEWPTDERQEYIDVLTGQARVQLFHRAWRHYEKQARAALAIAMPAAFEMAAEVAEKRAEARFADFGTTEPDTNASYYSGRRGETLDELDEEDWHIAQTIRAEGEKWK